MSRLPRLATWLLPAVLALVLAAPASATTFCVPTFHAACPNNGTNVAQANLETAMQSNAMDGIADTILIDAGTRTDADSFTAMGSDALEIVGAGPGATRLTTSSNANINVVQLGFDTRAVTMRDLTIVIPATIPVNNGGGMQARQDTITNVDIESQMHTHGTGIMFVGGGTYQDGAMYGASGGVLLNGIRVNSAASGPLEVTRSTFSNVSNGVSVDDPGVPTTLRRSRIEAPVQTGAMSSDGGSLTVENSVITDPGVIGVGTFSNSALSPTTTVRHTTIARIAGSTNVNPVSAQVANVVGNANATVTATGMIIRGFDRGYFRQAPFDVVVGNANLTITYSNFPTAGNFSDGDGSLTTTPGNIDQDPLFAGATNFHLLAGSPSIDTADPAPAVPVNEDFDGAPRPTDGNGDSIARRDMGAFEFPAAAPPPGGGSGTTPIATPTPISPKKCKKGQKLKQGKCVKKKRKKKK